MKKVLFVINTMGTGGAEKALLEMLEHLKGQDLSIDLYVLLGRGELMARIPKHVRLLNRKRDCGSVLDSAGRRALAGRTAACFLRNGHWAGKLGGMARCLPPMLWRGRVQLDKLLWPVVAAGAWRPEEPYDAAVAWMEGGSAYFVAKHVRAKRKAAVVHIDYQQSGYTPALDRGCWERFQRIFVVSEEIKAPFLRVYPQYEEKIRVLSNIINREAIRRRAGEPGGFTDGWQGMRLLTVGRLTHQKGFDLAIAAMKLLKDAGYPVRWYVLGEGGLRGSLEKQIADLGLQKDFLLLGTVENPYPYYAQADVYVHATRFEGRSIAIQEAQALGRPMVVSDCSGNRKQIEDGTDGLLCALEPEAIARTAGFLLDSPDLRERLGRAAGEKSQPGGQDAGGLLAFLRGGEGT